MFGWRGWLLGERQASKVKESSYNDRRAVYVIQMYLQIGMIWIYGYNMKGDLCPHWIREPGDDAVLWGARSSTAEVEKQGSLDPSRAARDISEGSCLRLRAASHFHMSVQAQISGNETRVATVQIPILSCNVYVEVSYLLAIISSW